MTKAREFWIDPAEDEGCFVALQKLPQQGPLLWRECLVHVREVLPDPTQAELFEMADKANACEHHFRAGFKAALDWMKGGK